MTTAEACRLLRCKTEYELAKRLKITQSAVTQWGRQVPKRRRAEIIEILKNERATRQFNKIELKKVPF